MGQMFLLYNAPLPIYEIRSYLQLVQVTWFWFIFFFLHLLSILHLISLSSTSFPSLKLPATPFPSTAQSQALALIWPVKREKSPEHVSLSSLGSPSWESRINITIKEPQGYSQQSVVLLLWLPLLLREYSPLGRLEFVSQFHYFSCEWLCLRHLPL